MNELVLDSLQRRMRAMHSLYYQAVESMELEHVNHFERDGVLPIAFSLFHLTNMIDASFMLLTGATPIWNDDWQQRVQMSVDDHGKHRTVDEMVFQRIRQLRRVQGLPARRVRSHGGLPRHTRSRRAHPRRYPPTPFRHRSLRPTAPAWPGRKG